MRLLYVVHRYAPYPGGSETHVQRLAEESARRGIDTWVLTGLHKGDLNGVKVTSDLSVAYEKWDAIIVHGSCPAQDAVHAISHVLESPIYYLLIQPNDSPIIQHGMKNAKWIGCGTSADIEFVVKHGHEDKIVHYQYPIGSQLVIPGASEALGIETPHLFFSAGGFWPHKGMDELARAFVESGRDKDTTLVLFGYDISHNPPVTYNPHIHSYHCQNPQEVMNVMGESDLYIQNSTSEGYGLCILEAMGAGTPWLSRNIAGAKDLHALHKFGNVYDDYEGLVKFLTEWKGESEMIMDERAMDFIHNNHLPKHSVDLIVSAITS